MKSAVLRKISYLERSECMYNFTITQVIYLVFKRLCDIFISTFFIVVLSPLILIIAILIKLSTKGSVVFSQKRVGQFGEIIKVYKFRTMRQDAPESIATGELDNPECYITKIGKILRLTSLDEILQLFNVLKGDMIPIPDDALDDVAGGVSYSSCWDVDCNARDGDSDD